MFSVTFARLWSLGSKQFNYLRTVCLKGTGPRMSDAVIANAAVWDWIHKPLTTFSFVLVLRDVWAPECCDVFVGTLATESSRGGAR
jgi:hypothetical protein